MQIAFLGDSLTEGWPGAAYFPLLQTRLPRHELLNLGRAGDTVADLLRRVAHRGLDPADLAFIWVGVNDAVMGAWDAVGDGVEHGWGRAQRLTRTRGDYEKLVEWTAARAARTRCVWLARPSTPRASRSRRGCASVAQPGPSRARPHRRLRPRRPSPRR